MEEKIIRTDSLPEQIRSKFECEKVSVIDNNGIVLLAPVSDGDTEYVAHPSLTDDGEDKSSISAANDKRELLRLKQGLITQSELIKEEKPIMPKLHGKKKVENFFYHYKVHLLLASVIVFAAVFMIHDVLSREEMDLRVLIVTDTAEAGHAVYQKTEELELAFNEICDDYDENGEAHADVWIINVAQEYADPNVFIANNTRLFSEIQVGVSQLLIGNIDIFYNMGGENLTEHDFFVDLSEIYPDNEHIEDKYFFKVKDSLLAKTAGWKDCPDDLYFAVRKTSGQGSAKEKAKNDEYRSRSLQLLDKIIKG